MSEVDDFLAETMPRFTEAEVALVNGDNALRKSMWSRHDPVTLFGAAKTARGWTEIEPVFDWLERSFAGCKDYDNEVIAAGASGDLAYVVALEHKTALVDDRPPHTYTLRVTTVFRREDGQWKIVHRHGDHLVEDGDLAERVGAVATS
jgi:ketosteroid isomerase-like protein